MKYWPLPDSYEDKLPKGEMSGAFWEERSGAFNCGVDIFAPIDSEVLSIDEGIVIDSGKFTSPEDEDYWNETFYVIIKTKEKINYKYCEMSEIYVTIGNKLPSGVPIGKIGKTVNSHNIQDDAPYFVREIAYSDYPAKLHLELYKAPIMEIRPYIAGNYEGEVKPKSLLDPNVYLMGLKKQSLAHGHG